MEYDPVTNIITISETGVYTLESNVYGSVPGNSDSKTYMYLKIYRNGSEIYSDYYYAGLVLSNFELISSTTPQVRSHSFITGDQIEIKVIYYDYAKDMSAPPNVKMESNTTYFKLTEGDTAVQ